MLLGVAGLLRLLGFGETEILPKVMWHTRVWMDVHTWSERVAGGKGTCRASCWDSGRAEQGASSAEMTKHYQGKKRQQAQCLSLKNTYLQFQFYYLLISFFGVFQRTK